jgi:hypothetical protein
MKKILFTTLILVFCASYTLSAQNDLEIKVESANQAFSENPEDALVVTIDGSYPAYTVVLYDKEPWTGAEPIQTIENVNESEYIFKNLETGTYHVCVVDARKNTDCVKAIVEPR